MEISWTNVTGDAANMVIEGVSLKPEGETEALAIGNVTLTGVTEENGGYSIETLTTSPFSKSEDGVSVDMSAFVVNGLNIPAEGATDPVSSMTMYESARLASLTVKVADKTAFAMQGLGSRSRRRRRKADGSSPAPQRNSAWTSRWSRIRRTRRYIDALGYQNLNGFFEMAGSWQPADGRWSLSQYDISIENAGTFGMTLDLGGFTPEFVKSIREISTRMAETSSGRDNSADEMAMLGLMQQMTFNSADRPFRRRQLTGRAINLVAKQQGQKPADIVNLAKAACRSR